MRVVTLLNVVLAPIFAATIRTGPRVRTARISAKARAKTTLFSDHSIAYEPRRPHPGLFFAPASGFREADTPEVGFRV